MTDLHESRGSVSRADSKKSGQTAKSQLTWASSFGSNSKSDSNDEMLLPPATRNDSQFSHFGTGSSPSRAGLASEIASAALAPLTPVSSCTSPASRNNYGSQTLSALSLSSKKATLSNEQRKRMEIVVHRATKYSCDKSFGARDSYVHFAQHGARFAPHEPSNIWNFSEPSDSARGVWKPRPWHEEERAVELREFLRSRSFTVTISLCLFVALLGTDVFVLCQVPGNVALDIIMTCILILFSAEIIGLAFVDIFYRCSFYFWMDVLGTTSLLCDISYLLGSDASKPEEYSASLIARGFHAAHLFSRIGRLFRVVRMFRLMHMYSEDSEADNVQMKSAISKQLKLVLPTRLAFLTILVALILPLFPMFDYPMTDESLSAWAQMLAINVAECHRSAHNSSESVLARRDLSMEVARFSNFYAKLPYGPFKICYDRTHDGHFRCQPGTDTIRLDSGFAAPRRVGSILQVQTQHLQIWYNLSSPQQVDAIANIVMILFVIVLMWVSGVSVSGSISEIALQPLDKILSHVRHRCSQIFKYTRHLQVGDVGEEVDSDDEEVQSEGESGTREQHVTNEFLLLEKAVAKLAAIAHLAATAQEDDEEVLDVEDSAMFSSMLGSQSGSGRLQPRQGSMLQEIGSVYESEEGKDDTSVLTSMISAIPSEVIESLHQATFNSLDLNKDVKITVAAYLALTSEGSVSWVRENIQSSQLYGFVSAVESKYLPNPFHNFAHALDVLNALYRFMPAIVADEFLSDMTQFWLIVAAIGHDIGHTGVNNPYLVEIAHELALTYNDRSPMENMHCAKLYQVLSDDDANIFKKVDKDSCKEMRKGIIAAILHTDVTKHNDMIKELCLLYQMNSDAFDNPGQSAEILQSQANTQLITNALLHFADINNPMRPWVICKQLAFLCLDEFFAQGDMEKSAGIPVQMLNDRDKVNRPNSQIGFIEFMIAPMVESMVHIFPTLDDLADNLGKNIQRWFDIWVEQASPTAEAQEKVNARVNKVVSKCRALMRGASDDVSHNQKRRGSILFG